LELGFQIPNLETFFFLFVPIILLPLLRFRIHLQKRWSKMSSSRGYSNSRGSHSFSISRNSGGSRNGGRIPNGGRNPNSGGRNPNQMSCTLPVCGCNLPMRMYISNTFENPGRRFWSCRRWNNEVSLIKHVSCMLFLFLI
jgi:hypothetical protein